MVKYKVEDRSKNTNFRSYIQLYKYDSDYKPQEEKDESGNNVFVYQNDTAYREAKKKEEVTGRCQVIFSFRLIL